MNPTFESIRLAIEAHMAAWGDVPVLPDGAATPNTDDPKDDRAVTDAIRAKASWVRCTIQHGASLTAGIGSGPCVRRTGLIQCQIFTPENKGSRPAAVLADSLAQHIEYHQDNQLETQAASIQRVGPSDGWYMYVLSCPFRAD